MTSKSTRFGPPGGKNVAFRHSITNCRSGADPMTFVHVLDAPSRNMSSQNGKIEPLGPPGMPELKNGQPGPPGFSNVTNPFVHTHAVSNVCP